MSLEEILDDAGDPQNTRPKQASQILLELLQEDRGRPSQTEGTRKLMKLRARDVAQIVEHLPSVPLSPQTDHSRAYLEFQHSGEKGGGGRGTRSL